MQHLKRCKIIARYGIGVDTIDLRAAAKFGIIASNVPDYGTQEVSDHALAMILCLPHKIASTTALVKGGQWDFRLSQPIVRHQVQTIVLDRQCHGAQDASVGYARAAWRRRRSIR